MLEHGANVAIELEDILILPEPFAVGRVGEEEGSLGGAGFEPQFLQAYLADVDILGESGGAYILEGGLHGEEGGVGAVDMVGEVPFLRVVGGDDFEEVGVEVSPFLEGEALAEDSGCDVECDECGLDEECAAAAHGVVEVGLSVPSGGEEHACGECLVEGCLGVGDAVTALMQRVTAAVQRECDGAVGDVYIEAYVGVGQADARALASVLEPPVGYSVLDAIGEVAGVAEGVRIDGGIDAEGGVGRHVVIERELFDPPVHLVGVVGPEAGDGDEDSRGRAEAEVSPIEHEQVAAEGDGAASFLYIRGPEGGQFGRQHIFQTLEGLGRHQELLLQHVRCGRGRH